MGRPAAEAASASHSRRRALAERGVAVLVIVLLLIALDIAVLAVTRPAQAPGAKHYYMALGDSIGFGYQPDLNFTSGYVDDVFADLRRTDVTDEENLACAGETTTTMIEGNCRLKLIHHNAYSGPQLTAAVNFLHAHPHAVSPVTLDIGANDIFADWDASTCSISPNAQHDLHTMDTNLTTTILPTLRNALGGTRGMTAANLVMLNYYNPFAKVCPNSARFIDQFNAHLAADAAQFHIPVADVYAAFGGDAHMADHICTYTWMCNPQYHDVHPTTTGYSVMARAVEQTLAYTGTSKNASYPALPFPGALGRLTAGALSPVHRPFR